MRNITRNDVNELLEMIYGEFYEQDLREDWYETLKNYNKEQIFNKAKELLDKGITPKINGLIADFKELPKTIDMKEKKLGCQCCGRIIEADKFQLHYERCSSIRYISKRYKQYFNKDLNKRELWEISKAEFDKRYDKLLETIYKVSKNANEKRNIAKILDLDTQEDSPVQIDYKKI